MADITEYSDIQQNAIREIVENDKGFHRTYLIADFPFYAMLEETENGQNVVKKNVSCSLSTSGNDYTLTIWYSAEQKCWFYNLNSLGEEVNGIVHYNTVCNAMGDLAFVILNDNLNDTDLSNSLPYSNVFVMRK